MDESAILLSMADRMLWIAALVAAPILIASLAIGLVIGLVQPPIRDVRERRLRPRSTNRR